MRLLIVSPYFWPENFRINDLAQGIIKLGHQVTVLTGKPNYPSGQVFDGYSFWGMSRGEMFAGIEVIRVPLVAHGTALNWLIRPSHFLRVLGLASLMDTMKVLVF